MRRPHRIRHRAAAGVAQGGDVIDVDAEAKGTPMSSGCGARSTGR
jgi:hypothetical protein